jgi:hypothetical protein
LVCPGILVPAEELVKAGTGGPEDGEAEVYGGRDRDGVAAGGGGDRERQGDAAGVPRERNYRADLLSVAQGVQRADEQAKRLKVLEKENSRHKRLVAELSLEKQILQEVSWGNF